MVLAALTALRLQLSGAVAPEPCVDAAAPAALSCRSANACALVNSRHTKLAQPLQLAQCASALASGALLPGPAKPVPAQQRAAASPVWVLGRTDAACGAALPVAKPQVVDTPRGTCTGAACRQPAASARAEARRTCAERYSRFDMPGGAGAEGSGGAAGGAECSGQHSTCGGAAAVRGISGVPHSAAPMRHPVHVTGLQGIPEADAQQSRVAERVRDMAAAGAVLQRSPEELPWKQHGAAQRAHAAAAAGAVVQRAGEAATALSWAGQGDARVRATDTCAVPAKAWPVTAGEASGSHEPATTQLAAGVGGAFGASVPLWDLLRAEISSRAFPQLAGQHGRPDPDPDRLLKTAERAPEATARFAAAWQRVVSTHDLAQLLAEGNSPDSEPPTDLRPDQFIAKPGRSSEAGSAAAGVGCWGAGGSGCARGLRLPPRNWAVLAAGLLLMGGSLAASGVMLFWMVGAKLVPPERAAVWLGRDWGPRPDQAWWLAAWAFAAADTHYCLLLPLTLPVALAFVTVNWSCWKLFKLN